MAATATGGVKPAMAYQPLNSPGLGYGSNGENNSRRWTVSFSLAAFFRILVALTALVNIIIWIRLGVINPKYSPMYLVFIELFLVIVWNMALLVPHWLPARGCQVGSTYWVLNDADNRDWPLNKPAVRLQRWKKCLVTAAVDLFFGLTITLIISLGWKDLPYWYRKFGGTDCLLPLNIVVGAFELSLVVIGLIGYYWSLAFDFGVALKRSDPEANTRIRLTPDIEDRRTAGGTASFTD